jgi:hypothetical protein
MDTKIFEFLLDDVEDGLDQIHQRLREDGFPEHRLAEIILVAREMVISNGIPDIQKCWTTAETNNPQWKGGSSDPEFELTRYLCRSTDDGVVDPLNPGVLSDDELADLSRRAALNGLFGAHAYFDTVAAVEGRSQSDAFQNEHVTELSALRQTCNLIDFMWRHVKTESPDASQGDLLAELDAMLEDLDLDLSRQTEMGMFL